MCYDLLGQVEGAAHQCKKGIHTANSSHQAEHIYLIYLNGGRDSVLSAKSVPNSSHVQNTEYLLEWWWGQCASCGIRTKT